jgi:transcriptional regulatory protein
MIQELSEREHSILNRLMVQGAVSVADLSSELAVSEVTIRSDLSSLEERGLLSRTHGGALPSIHPHIFQRQNMNIEEKHRIAKAAADLVEDGDAIMIEAGTTTSLLPRYLAGKRDILIITNSIPAFESAKSNPALKITLVGGEFRDSTDSFVGRITLDTIRRFNVRCAFVGTDGFSLKSGITTHLIEGGDVISVMRERAENLVLLADSSKYGKTGVVTILPLSQINTLITDTGLSDTAKEELNQIPLHIIAC